MSGRSATTIRRLLYTVAVLPLLGSTCQDGERRSCTEEEIEECQDGDFCNGRESCMINLSAPLCAPSLLTPCLSNQICDEPTDTCKEPECETDSDCDDQVTCTMDRCVEGRCINGADCSDADNVGCPCDDNNPCTVDEVCAGGGVCEGVERMCPAGQVCKDGSGDCVDAGPAACCLPSGLCEDLSYDDCSLRVGGWAGPATTCAETTCATGACCLPSGACSVLTEAACAEDMGVYQGDDAACEDVDCTRGACCTGTDCSILSQSECQANGGSYEGDGVPCAVDTCGDPVACCVQGAGGSGNVTNTCELQEDAAACSASGGSVIPGQTTCPDFDPADDFDACVGQLSGSWSMRIYDPATGTFSGNPEPQFFTGVPAVPGDLSSGFVLVDGRPTVIQSSTGSTNLYYTLYQSYALDGSTVVAQGCDQPANFPGGQYWTERTISGGTLTRDACTGECVLSFSETLVTTEPDGDMFTSEFFWRSVGRSELPQGLCYRPCLDACNPTYLPGRCWRTPPDPPYMTEFGDQDTWVYQVLQSRTCLE